MSLENEKLVANDIFDIFSRHTRGECTYDRALEDVSIKIMEYCHKRPIEEYVSSGNVRKVLSEIHTSKKQDKDKTYMFKSKYIRMK